MKELIKLITDDIKTGNNGGLMLFWGCNIFLYFFL